MNWTYNHDVMLCREILVVEPFRFKHGSRDRGNAWENVATNLNGSGNPKFNVDQRAVRDHFLKLERCFKRKLAEDERASGISPEHTELDDALEEIIEKSKAAEEELGKKSDSNRKLADSERETAEDVRKRSMERLSETQKRDRAEREKKRRKENTQSDAVQYLKEKSDKEFEIREKELELKERKLQFKERKQQFKFELERKEHEERIKDQKVKQERENNIILLMQQQLLQQQQLIDEIKKQNLLIASILNK